MNSSRVQRYLLLCIAVVARVIPHPWNMTPSISLSVISAQMFSKTQAILLSLLGFIISDSILACIQHHSLFGSWSLFTYSGIAVIAYAAQYCRQSSRLTQGLSILGFSLLFWLWTNFGSFLFMGYSKNFNGLLQCYLAAIPFLKNQLLGDLLYSSVLLGAYHYCKQPQLHPA